MRGESVATGQYNARTESESAADTTCFGYNVLKVARYINLIVGCALSVVCTLRILDIFNNIGDQFFAKLGLVQVNVFLG